MTHHNRLIDTFGDNLTIYFCGLAKNAGKTVALRQALQEARAAGKRVAVTSVGRDGEAFDAIYTDFAKPRLRFMPGEVVVGCEGLLPEATHCTILHRFDASTPLGRIAAARIEAECEIEVAGPSTVSALRQVRSWIASHGIDLFLVDGALDRKAASLPDVCDGIVLSTGAVLGDQMDAVIDETRSALEILGLDSDEPVAGEHRLSYSPIFDSESVLRNLMAQAAECEVVIDIQGGVSDRLVEQLMRAGLLRRVHLVVDCFAKVFLHRQRWKEYRRNGLRISYRRQVRVLSLTVNPVAPMRPGFISEDFLVGMRAAVHWLPVFDVCAEGYRDTGT